MGEVDTAPCMRGSGRAGEPLSGKGVPRGLSPGLGSPCGGQETSGFSMAALGAPSSLRRWWQNRRAVGVGRPLWRSLSAALLPHLGQLTQTRPGGLECLLKGAVHFRSSLHTDRA